MTPDRWQQCKAIFQAALDVPVGKRANYVRDACGSDAELQAEILSLLEFQEQSKEFLSDAAPRYLAGERGDETRPKPRLHAGELLSDRYRIVGLIGRGGMGEVYESVDIELGARVALKLIRPEIAAGAEVLDRFKREVYLARQVTHPNVCRIFDLEYHIGPAGRTAFLTMELLAGETLAHRLARTAAMTTDEALPLIKQMVLGLTAAHEAGIIHRDFKSANVMLVPEAAIDGTDPADHVKIMDFGLARVVSGGDGAQTTLSAASLAVGTPAYMAPEQVQGGDITTATDIYALGIVMYEMVTGKLPFDGDSPWIVATKRLLEAAPSPRSQIGNLDPTWETVILRCLERNPADRFQNAGGVYSALCGQPIPQLKSSIAKTGKRRRRQASALVTAVLLLGLAAVYYVVSKSSRQPAKNAQTLSDTRPAKFGWHRTTFTADASLSAVRLAAGPTNPLKILMFGPSFVRSWAPGQDAAPPLPTPFTVADRADCAQGLWLIHDDRRHITEWNSATDQPLTTKTIPWSFTSAACLDDTASRWGLLVNRAHSSRWIEFDTRTNQTLREVPLDDFYVKAMIHPVRNSIVLIGNNQISMRGTEKLEEIFHDTLDEKLISPWAAAWSEGGRYFAVGFKQLVIYDVTLKRRAHSLTTTGWISAIGWIGDEGVTVMDDRGRLYWTSDLSKDWQLTAEAQAVGVYTPFWIASHYRWVALNTAGQGQEQVWQYITPSLLFDIPVSPLDIWSVAVSPDGSKLAVSGKDPRIFILDLTRGSVVQVLEGHTDGIPFARYTSPDRLISASDDKTIRIWDTATGRLLKTATGHESLVNAFATTPDGRWLVSVSSDNDIKLWSFPELTFVRNIGTTTGAGAAVAFLRNDDRRLLISDWKGHLYRYEGSQPNWSLREEYQLGDQTIYMICPSQDAWWTVGPDGNGAGLWLVPASSLKKAVRVSATPAYYCATADDGQLTAVQFANRIQLLSNANGKPTGTYRFGARTGDAVAITHEPARIIGGFRDGHLMGWPLQDR